MFSSSNLADWERTISQQLESYLSTGENFSDVPLALDFTGQDSDRVFVNAKIIGNNSDRLQYSLLKIHRQSPSLNHKDTVRQVGDPPYYPPLIITFQKQS